MQREASDALDSRGWKTDYVAIRQPDRLWEPATSSPVVFAAARLGITRLIDNIELPPDS
ncbi:MAG: pantoate--beta-alanine ligase [Steroidobacteraceae bacterium]